MSVTVNLDGCVTVCGFFVQIFLVCGAGRMFPDVDKQFVNEENKKMASASGELVSVLESHLLNSTKSIIYNCIVLLFDWF